MNKDDFLPSTSTEPLCMRPWLPEMSRSSASYCSANSESLHTPPCVLFVCLNRYVGFVKNETVSGSDSAESNSQ